MGKFPSNCQGFPPGSPSHKHPTMHLTGYASIFHVKDLAKDIVHPGAFRNLKLPLPLKWGHEKIIGVVNDAYEDAIGLFIHARVDDPMAIQIINHGKVNHLSIGYRALGFTRDDNTRYLNLIDMVEVSVVFNPCQPLARFWVDN